ncbi:MAG: cation:dicarboxylase symporter family transporter [Verrucomicrobia bacterium]|nr:cation:dicarboxylase symporter family transporter [Verrucomicrobiota bacterium]
MFRKMPFILLLLIALIVLLDSYLPLTFKSALYSLSLSIKSILVFVLPAVIFALLFKTAAQLARNATKFILILLAAVCVSNFLSTTLSGQVGWAVYHLNLSIPAPEHAAELIPLWTFTCPKWIGNGQAMFLGLFLGWLFSLIRPESAQTTAAILEKAVSQGLRLFIYTMPFFIAGFIAKLSHEKVFGTILQNYSLIFLIVAAAQYTYVLLLYLVADPLNFKRNLKNMLPAVITGCSTMSSAAAMPLTIMGVEKNAKNPDVARSIIPATVNIHLIGDCFAIPIFAFAILKNFGVEQPDLMTYLVFAGYFVLAKFSVAAIPGGGILVMLPILESYLGFQSEMMSLITGLYILFDPVITPANILGNGAFALIVSKFQGKKRLQNVN